MMYVTFAAYALSYTNTVPWSFSLKVPFPGFTPTKENLAHATGYQPSLFQQL